MIWVLAWGYRRNVNAQSHLFNLTLPLRCIFIGPNLDHIALRCLWVTLSLLVLTFDQIIWFVKVVTLISLSCYMDLSKLIHGFLYVDRGNGGDGGNGDEGVTGWPVGGGDSNDRDEGEGGERGEEGEQTRPRVNCTGVCNPQATTV